MVKHPARSALCGAQFYNFRRLPGDELLDVVAPSLQDDAHFGFITVCLIDADDTGKTAGDVVQAALDQMHRNTETLHSTGGATA